jgi:hypothetical protein
LLLNKLVKIKTKLFLLTLILFTLFYDISAQKTNKKITISGKVTDLKNTRVSGAFLMIDGKNIDKKTNSEGLFKVRVKSSALKIGIFTTFPDIKEEPINGRTTINFNLDKVVSPQFNAGHNVSDYEVVSEGYNVARKKDITNSVTKSDVR